MIELTLEQIANSIKILKTLSERTLNAKLAYKLGKIILAVEDENKILQSTQAKIIADYSEKNEDGSLKQNEEGQVTIPAEFVKEVQTQLNELLTTKVELNVLPLTIAELENYSFSPSDMIALMPFIEE